MIPVPVLTRRLSSLWLGLVTPLYARVGRDLIESICHETVVRDERARRDFEVEPLGVREALANEDREFAQTRSRRGEPIRACSAATIGLLYWYGIYPLHAAVFRGMLAGIARAARREGGGRDT